MAAPRHKINMYEAVIVKRRQRELTCAAWAKNLSPFAIGMTDAISALDCHAAMAFPCAQVPAGGTQGMKET